MVDLVSMTIYTRKTCAPCKTLKYWLGKKGISYDEVDLDERPVEGVLVAPTVELNGERIEGLNFAALNVMFEQGARI